MASIFTRTCHSPKCGECRRELTVIEGCNCWLTLAVMKGMVRHIHVRVLSVGLIPPDAEIRDPESAWNLCIGIRAVEVSLSVLSAGASPRLTESDVIGVFASGSS